MRCVHDRIFGTQGERAGAGQKAISQPPDGLNERPQTTSPCREPTTGLASDFDMRPRVAPNGATQGDARHRWLSSCYCVSYEASEVSVRHAGDRVSGWLPRWCSDDERAG